MIVYFDKLLTLTLPVCPELSAVVLFGLEHCLIVGDDVFIIPLGVLVMLDGMVAALQLRFTLLQEARQACLFQIEQAFQKLGGVPMLGVGSFIGT